MNDPRLARTSRELFLSALTGGTADLDTWLIDRMTSVVEEEDVESGQRLFAQGEQPEFIFFVRDGKVRLERDGSKPWLFAGRSVVGVFDALLDRPHTRTAVAETGVHVLKLRVEHWLDLLEDSFGLARLALANSVATVASLETRRWKADPKPQGSVVAPVLPIEPPLAFVDRLAILAETPLLRGAGIQVLVDVAEFVAEVTFPPGEAIFERGQQRGQAFLVLEGQAVGDWNDPKHNVSFGPGSLVGGVASLGEPIAEWQAHAATQVRALSVPLEDWFNQMEEHFDLVRSALCALAIAREAILEDLAAREGDLSADG